MQELFQQLRDQVTRAWQQLTMQQKVLFVAIPVGLMIALGVAVYYASQPEFTTLVRTEDQAQLDRIRQYLQENGYNFEITSANTIQVDERVKQRLAIELAGQGLVGFQTGAGFELFDETRLGMTDRMFDLNKIRAQQNTLAQWIQEGSPRIQSARVMISPGKESIFRRDQIAPTASVKLVETGQLTEQEIKGIQSFVATAYEGMQPSNVTVVNRNNEVVSEETGTEPGVAQATRQMEVRFAVESDIRRKLESQLETLVGPDNYKVEVTAVLDWEKRNQKSIGIDSEGAAPISERSYEEQTTSQGISGPPGTVSNVQDTGIGAETEQTGSEISESLTNYQYPWTETMIEKSQGAIQELYVSIFVDYVQNEEGEWVPLDQQEIQVLERSLRPLAMLSAEEIPGEPVRFTIEPWEFDRSLEEELAQEEFWATVTSVFQTLLPLILLLSVGYLAYLFFQRAFAPAEVELEEEEEVPIEPVTEAKELTLSQLGLAEFGDVASLPAEEQRRLKMQEHVINYAQEKPEEVAAIIRAWLSS